MSIVDESPFTITVYDKAFQKKGTVGSPVSVSVTVRHNQQPTAQMVVSALHPRIGDLMEPGARVWIRYRGDHLMSGPVRLRQAHGPTSSAAFTFQVTDDWFLFSRLLAWPTPGADLASQTSEQDVRSGPAESVLKGYVSANVGRSSPPVTVGSDLGRGDTISLALRFKPLTDQVIPAVDAAGIGTVVAQAGAGLVMDVYETRTYPRTLTEDSRTVVDWDLSHADPEATQLVVGGQGEGTARLLVLVPDPVNEALYGYSIEAFKDDTSVTTTDALTASGNRTLTEQGPSSGMSVALSETSAFRYDPTGVNGVRVGDILPIQVGPTLTVTDVLRQCTLTWSADNGFTVTPQVGERKGDTTLALKTAIAALARGFRNLTGR